MKTKLSLSVFLFSSLSFAREYKPQPIEVYLTKQSQAEAALWDKSCAAIGNKVVVRKGPWAFGFFSEAKCLPLNQEPGRSAPWVMKIDSQGSQTTVEILQRVVGDALTTIASTSFPFNGQNIEWLQTNEFSNIIAAALLDQLPALMSVGGYQPELLVPEVAILPPSKELVWGTLDFDDKLFKFSSNVMFGVKPSASNGFTRFTLDGQKPKGSQTVWIFNQKGPRARFEEIKSALKQTHQKLIDDSPLTPKLGADEDPWQHILGLRVGMSLSRSPAMLKSAKLIELTSDNRGGAVKGTYFSYRYAPKSVADENGVATSYTMSNGRLGYRFAWNVQKSILYSVAVIPNLGLWSLTTSYPTTIGSSTSVEHFAAKQELSIGAAFVAELELLDSLRIQGVVARDIAGPILGSKTRTSVNAAQYGLNGYWVVGPTFNIDKTSYAMFINGFIFLENISMESTQAENVRSSIVLNTGFMGLGSGVRW